MAGHISVGDTHCRSVKGGAEALLAAAEGLLTPTQGLHYTLVFGDVPRDSDQANDSPGVITIRAFGREVRSLDPISNRRVFVRFDNTRLQDPAVTGHAALHGLR